MHKCCNNLKWERISDLGHADGAEFTLGHCLSCGANLVHLWAVSTGGPGGYAVVDADFIKQVDELKGVALKNFMRGWLNAD